MSLLALALAKGYTCPITREIIIFPYTIQSSLGEYPLNEDGTISAIEKNHTFERDAIYEWVVKNRYHTNPITREPLKFEQCVLNERYQSEIENFVKIHAEVFKAEAQAYFTQRSNIKVFPPKKILARCSFMRETPDYPPMEYAEARKAYTAQTKAEVERVRRQCVLSQSSQALLLSQSNLVSPFTVVVQHNVGEGNLDPILDLIELVHQAQSAAALRSKI